MSRDLLVASFFAVCTFLSVRAYAGPLLPCVSSTQSANGNVLVTDTLGFDSPDETQPRGITRSTYQVYRRFTEPNEGLRLNGPNTYWTDPFWKVEFHRDATRSLFACTYVLVPDSGEYLIFIGTTSDRVAFTIYHHRPHDPSLGPLVSQQGELVREITRAALPPADPREDKITNGTPQWFAGGSFAFSPDGKHLLYGDRNGRKIEIDLASGEFRHSD